MLMQNLTTEETFLFTYENWLSKTKGPKRTRECELPAVVDEEEMVEKTTYVIQVQTGDAIGESPWLLANFLNKKDGGVKELYGRTNHFTFHKSTLN